MMVATTGCAVRSAPYVVHPNAVNELDSRTYDALLFAKGMLDEADRKPPTQAVLISMIANLRKVHDVAKADWQLYRAAVKAGRPAADLEVAVKSSAAALNAVVTAPDLASFRP